MNLKITKKRFNESENLPYSLKYELNGIAKFL